MKFIGFYDYTVILTYISLISGVLGMKFACDGRFGLSICCLAMSGFCDMFDGVVARSKKNRTPDEKNFGIQLDSLCDIVCFGVFPAVFLYFNGVKTIYGIIILLFYVLCALIRLAFFNVLEMKRQMTETGCAKKYRGLPVTSISIILPFIYLFNGILTHQLKMAVYNSLPILIGILFIADIGIPKLDVAKLLRHIFSRKDRNDEETASCEKE